MSQQADQPGPPTEEVNAACFRDLQELEENWKPRPDETIEARLKHLFGFEQGQMDSTKALEVYERAITHVTILNSWAESKGDGEAISRVNTVVECVREAYQALTAISYWMNVDRAIIVDSAAQLLRFTNPVEEKIKPINLVFKYTLGWCRHLGLRHCGGIVYNEHISRGGHKTRAWVPARERVPGYDISTMKGLLSFVTKRGHSQAVYDQWISVSVPALVEKLELCNEEEFPQLTRTRSWLAFSDGLYSVMGDMFIRYADEHNFEFETDMAVCSYKNVPFQNAFYSAIDGKHISSPLTQISTPCFDSIFKEQKLDPHTVFCILVMMGRCLYWANVLDSWQTALFIKGVAGTGKGTLLAWLQDVYDAADTANIGNDVQEGFGLQPLAGNKKYLWVAPEVKTDFKLDQAQFQSLVSNEPMSIGVKHSEAYQGPIHAHGILAGNTLPLKWMDNAGSIQRRLIVVNFRYQVENKRGDLLGRLKVDEFAGILRKINWAYRHAASLMWGRDMLSSGIMSPHIMNQNEAMFTLMNPLRLYMKDGGVKVGEVEVKNPENETQKVMSWCPVDAFQQKFNTFCALNKRSIPQWTEDMYFGPLKSHKCRVQYAKFTWAGVNRTGPIVYGACMSDEISSMGHIPPTLQDDVDVDENIYALIIR